jgi:hypothetical protein
LPHEAFVPQVTRMRSSTTNSPPPTSHPSQSSVQRCAASSAPRSGTPAPPA